MRMSRRRLIVDFDETRNQYERSRGLYFCHKGRLYCAITGRLVTDDRSLYAKRRGPRRIYDESVISVHRDDTLYPVRQAELKRKDGHCTLKVMGRNGALFRTTCRAVIATFRVASLTLQTRKLWLVGVATDRDAPLACPKVKTFFFFF